MGMSADVWSLTWF